MSHTVKSLRFFHEGGGVLERVAEKKCLVSSLICILNLSFFCLLYRP